MLVVVSEGLAKRASAPKQQGRTIEYAQHLEIVFPLILLGRILARQVIHSPKVSRWVGWDPIAAKFAGRFKVTQVLSPKSISYHEGRTACGSN
jgi:hypothetical protein